MSKKKRRKRPAPLRQPDSPPKGQAAGTRRQGGQKGSGGKASARSGDRARRPRTAADRRRVVQEWAHPPVALSVVRGLQSAGASPLLVVSSFLSALVLWLIFTTYGAAPAPSAMVLMTALPPVHSLLIDIGAVLTGGSTAAAGTLLFLAGLLVLRAGLLSLWVAGSLDRLERREATSDDLVAGGRGEVSRVLRRAARAFTTMLGIEAGFYVLSMVTALLAVGFAIGQLAVIGGLIGGLLFLVFAPVIVVAEGAGPAAAFRLSVRAARLPGPRHMMATVAYVAMTLVVSLFAPSSRVAQATPAITTWLFVLFVTFLHVSALAMFVYRWLAVRDRVLQEASTPSGGKRERAAPASLR